MRYMDHMLWDNRHGLIANAMVAHANAYAEGEAAKSMLSDARGVLGRIGKSITVGAEKGYHAAEFIDVCAKLKVTPHWAQNNSKCNSSLPDDIAQTPGYAASQKRCKVIEQGFGWAKQIGNIRHMMVRGIKRVDQVFVLAMVAYNLVRMRTWVQIPHQWV
jgi:hypothetical protein